MNHHTSDVWLAFRLMATPYIGTPMYGHTDVCHHPAKKTCQKGELQLTYITTMVEIDLWNKNMLKLHVGYM